MTLIRYFHEIDLKSLPQVGGKNASLGEMYQNLSAEGIQVPDGFATTAEAYRLFLDENNLRTPLRKCLARLDRNDFSNLTKVGEQARELMRQAHLPAVLEQALQEGYDYLANRYGHGVALAVRSSATAEDLPEASFAGQQESFLNVKSYQELLEKCHRCFVSLYTDRAIKYREDQGFEHEPVALSVGVQLMVRSDQGASGVIFTLDPNTGFDRVVLLTGAWGLGENVVQGSVNPDEFYVFKPTLQQGRPAILSRRLGSKLQTMMTCTDGSSGIVNLDTPTEKRDQFVLSDDEVTLLARWSLRIEKHYGRPMDIEWAKDGYTGKLFIVQARPETVHSSQRSGRAATLSTYTLQEKGPVLCQGIGLGNRIASGRARILHSPSEAHKLQEGEILVTPMTNPDWDPILKKAAGIVTNQGGRTSHAAIVAREVGAVAVVGTGNATSTIRDGQEVTLSCAEGARGVVYDGKLAWEEKALDLTDIDLPQTQVMLILGDPDQAFQLAQYPHRGIGLMRMEFIINNAIQIHPMALKQFAQLEDEAVKARIEALTRHYPDKEAYFVEKLAEAVATIAAAFHPHDVIVRMSDFKSNEYANLIGGHLFEPQEANPMLGFRGASRYYHPRYQPGFELECRALRQVRDVMGLENVKVMIPFCRTFEEARRVIDIMAQCGLERGQNGLELYMMVELPSNVMQAEAFAAYFDGFSIGSNDLTQLTLGIDRDSDLLSGLFRANDPAVKAMIAMVIASAHKTHTKIGLCGQAPSDDPTFAQFLVEEGIDSVSFNPDALIEGIRNIHQAESTRVHA
ncbi:pyruvate, water dikinase [Catalinimonas alkaloidigena]|uniref:Phosphoenolpyruvate synthase n=1 Tax=Catalinimonas alkaloidigena TaxID=1075417 RepID=A0A1G9NZT6_9BACT|nr:phosphoenolpyruvate synthase [Catalinimonas alkaloidigena]SDL91919.1 pyruvate, water dikinase [Catalinimonas alkaloidigena]